MKKRMKEVKEKEIEELIKEVESAKNDAKMFKAVKALQKRNPGIQFVHDENNKCMKQPQEIYKIIEKHFKEHFQKINAEKIIKFSSQPKKLTNEITTKEVRQAIQKMSNNKAPGKDGINVELIKYGPEESHEEISTILNDIFRFNDEEIKIGTGILLPVPKQKKTKRTCQNLRPNYTIRNYSQSLIKNFHGKN
eukprot:Seg270.3 transcript_id=Seg270.3/GoldUCD/mRNA.D3Y31 product="hypothetical protein" protein_id=Seg270.3/GoldUCD/D3Y31